MPTTSRLQGRSLLPEDAKPCVWMAARIVSYKLCDRSFDCDRCPLDAALRGKPLAAPFERAARRIAFVFPDDRRYGSSHVWARPLSSGRIRLGLDAFAAELLASAADVELPTEGDTLATGDTFCTIEGHPGRVPIRAPVGGRITATNDELGYEPDNAIGDPYEGGWLVDLEPLEPAPELLSHLVGSTDARKRARSDMDRFRRQVAMQLLVGSSQVGPSMADGGEGLTDLRQMLGAERYLKIVTEVLG
jgi:glycine cleavage system H protein